MATNRRLWLKQISLGIGALGLANFKAIASPGKHELFKNIGDGTSPVLLSSNENPYVPSPLARKACDEALVVGAHHSKQN